MAIASAKKGAKIARKGWNGKGMFVALQDNTGKTQILDGETYPLTSFLVIKSVDGTLGPWLASPSDTLAEDWGIV